MSQITWKKEIVFRWNDNHFYIISLELENNLEYTDEDIQYVKKLFNEWLGKKGWIAKNWSYIYWSVRKK